MILFDGERLKYSASGLFFFCDQLANALSIQAEFNPNHRLNFYVPAKYKGRWGNKCQYTKMNSFHELFFYNPQIKLWHSTYQLTRYMPVSAKKIQTIHDLNYLYEPLGEKKKQQLPRRISNHLKKLSYIIAISESTKEDILNHFDTKDIPIEVIYNGCNTYQGSFQRPRQISDRPFLFTIGTVMPKKNFHVLPCLLKGNDYELVISGAHIVPDYVEQIYAEAKKWNVAGRIHVTGVISEAEKHWYMKHCTAFLFPSIAEGFGLPVIEAMQYGKPVFLSSHTCLPEIGGKQAYYFNREFDREGLVQEFRQGMDDYSCKDKTEEIRSHALSFSWENAAKRYWTIYNAVLNQ